MCGWQEINGLGLTAELKDHCKLILKYPRGTNSTWVHHLSSALGSGEVTASGYANSMLISFKTWDSYYIIFSLLLGPCTLPLILLQLGDIMSYSMLK